MISCETRESDLDKARCHDVLGDLFTAVGADHGLADKHINKAGTGGKVQDWSKVADIALNQTKEIFMTERDIQWIDPKLKVTDAAVAKLQKMTKLDEIDKYCETSKMQNAIDQSNSHPASKDPHMCRNTRVCRRLAVACFSSNDSDE